VEPMFVPVSGRTLSLMSNSNLLKLWVKFCYYINILCLHSQKQGSRNSDMNTLGFCSGSQAIVHWYAACTYPLKGRSIGTITKYKYLVMWWPLTFKCDVVDKLLLRLD
jgi:hypothetical protein